jgi:hypothetical protein
MGDRFTFDVVTLAPDFVLIRVKHFLRVAA